MVRAQHGSGGHEPPVQVGEVAPGDGAEPLVGSGQVLGGDPHATGDHQPAGELAQVAGHGQLLLHAEASEAGWAAIVGTEGPGAAQGRCPGPKPGSVEFSGEDRDEILVLLGDPEPGAAHSDTAWASIASAALRYSPASQSLARCR